MSLFSFVANNYQLSGEQNRPSQMPYSVLHSEGSVLSLPCPVNGTRGIYGLKYFAEKCE